MPTKFVTGVSFGEDSFGEDSFLVGKDVAGKALEKMKGEKIHLSIVFCSSEYNYVEVIKGIKEITQNAPLIGCSSAGEFTEERVGKKSVCCALISSNDHKFFLGCGKEFKGNEIEAVKQATGNFSRSVNDYPYLSCLQLIDGLTGKGEEVTLAVSSVLGSLVRLIGGAAGDDLKFKETKVFMDNQINSNTIALCLIASKIPVGIGVKHGHTPLSPALNVTKSAGCILYELNSEPAFEVWKKYTRERAKEQFDINVDKLSDFTEIGSYLIKYEVGVLTGIDYKIRIPFSANPDGSLNLVCPISEDTIIKIMESSKDAQINSAREAARLAVASLRGAKIAGAIIFDCVCRALILKDEFYQVIEAIKEVIGKDVPLIGLETYGEIAMELGQLSGFHNTTTTILLIPER